MRVFVCFNFGSEYDFQIGETIISAKGERYWFSQIVGAFRARCFQPRADAVRNLNSLRRERVPIQVNAESAQGDDADYDQKDFRFRHEYVTKFPKLSDVEKRPFNSSEHEHV